MGIPLTFTEHTMAITWQKSTRSWLWGLFSKGLVTFRACRSRARVLYARRNKNKRLWHWLCVRNQPEFVWESLGNVCSSVSDLPVTMREFNIGVIKSNRKRFNDSLCLTSPLCRRTLTYGTFILCMCLCVILDVTYALSSAFFNIWIHAMYVDVYIQGYMYVKCLPVRIADRVFVCHALGTWFESRIIHGF